MKTMRLFLLLGLVVAVSGQAFGQAVIATSISSGDPSEVGMQFTVQVAVVSNDTGKQPFGFSGRVNYNTNSVSFVSVGTAETGPALPGPEEGTAPNRFRDIATMSDLSAPMTPVCCYITFQVLASPTVRFDITMESDPENDTLVEPPAQAFLPSEYSFDNTATTGIGEVPVLDWSLY